ncbi:TPA: hypothetical protein QCS32_006147 [Bacillus thuringiensis]|uniref:Endospore appendages core domain-containing protein n=1 Tax=Bacillus thuringiensis serovar iberica TaxID=180866 RepID=A0A9X6L8T7_BACTU|nr:S-Ena type endospore appendage [Bacillus thuringiensis]OUB40122.1 hypothetical protein BK741_32230 [Bacillus thuringiensis serovar iberica]HDR5354328.1 hypothetical protein [Bacillus thuringiensis]
MSRSESCLNNCCPESEIIQEEICGNFSYNEIPAGFFVLFAVAAADTSYISGTFEVFNSASSAGNATVNITGIPNTNMIVQPGVSGTRTVTRPTQFTITVPPNTSGTYCLTLYKRISA